MKEIKSNGLGNIISQAIEEMKSEQGDHFSLEKNNLAELERRTGISRAKMRRFKKNGFVFKPHGLEGRKAPRTILTGYTAILDDPAQERNHQLLSLPGTATGRSRRTDNR